MYTIRFLQNCILDLVQTAYNNTTDKMETIIKKFRVRQGDTYKLASFNAPNSFEFDPQYNIVGNFINVPDDIFRLRDSAAPPQTISNPGCYTCREKRALK